MSGRTERDNSQDSIDLLLSEIDGEIDAAHRIKAKSDARLCALCGVFAIYAVLARLWISPFRKRTVDFDGFDILMAVYTSAMFDAIQNLNFDENHSKTCASCG